MAPEDGFEPPPERETTVRSAAELPGIDEVRIDLFSGVSQQGDTLVVKMSKVYCGHR